MPKRSSKQSSSSPVVRFLKEWGLFSIIVGLIIASRIYLWAPVKVDGHSMDPTLADSEYLLVVNHLSIDRFDICRFSNINILLQACCKYKINIILFRNIFIGNRGKYGGSSLWSCGKPFYRGICNF